MPAVKQPIHHKKKDGDWYIYPQFLAHETPKNVHKNAQKSSNLAYTMLLVQGRISQKVWLSYVPIGCVTVRFARYCGKMYSRHLFPYRGLERGPRIREKQQDTGTRLATVLRRRPFSA